MLTGSHPFRNSLSDDHRHFREDPPALDNAVPGLPAGVAKIVDVASRKHATDRRHRPGTSASSWKLPAPTAAGRRRPGMRSPPASCAACANRILAISCGLLVLLSMAVWGFVRVMADRAVTGAIEADLTRAERLVQRVQRDRLTTLALTARLVACFPTSRRCLHRLRHRSRSRVLPAEKSRDASAGALAPDGKMIARTDEVSAGGDDAWFGVLARQEEPAVSGFASGLITSRRRSPMPAATPSARSSRRYRSTRRSPRRSGSDAG
jgi:hypothetical protein